MDLRERVRLLTQQQDEHSLRIERDREVKAANSLRKEVVYLASEVARLTEAVSSRQAQVTNLQKVAQSHRDTIYKLRTQLRDVPKESSSTPIVISQDEMLRLVRSLPNVEYPRRPQWEFPVSISSVSNGFTEPDMTVATIELGRVGRRTRLWRSEAQGWRIGQFLVVP